MLLVSVLLSAAVGASSPVDSIAQPQQASRDPFAASSTAQRLRLDLGGSPSVRASRSPAVRRAPRSRAVRPERPRSDFETCGGSSPCSAFERAYQGEESRQRLLRFDMLLW